eukprot:366078-Chlamydomonas_euryale.AAC.5
MGSHMLSAVCRDLSRAPRHQYGSGVVPLGPAAGVLRPQKRPCRASVVAVRGAGVGGGSTSSNERQGNLMRQLNQGGGGFV